MQLFRLVKRSLFEQHICEIVAGILEPLERILIGANHRRDHRLDRRLDAALGNQVLLLDEQLGRLEVRSRLHQTDHGAIGRDHRHRVHQDLGAVLVNRDRVGDDEPRLAYRLELGSPVIRQQVLDRQLVEIEGTCDMAKLHRPVVGISRQDPPCRCVRMQLQHIAQIFAGQILGDDLAARPHPTQRCRPVSDNGGHPPKTTRHSPTCPVTLVLLPRSPAGSPVAHHARCWPNQFSMSCHACSAASAL